METLPQPQRDPRFDPREGDIVENKGTRRTVSHRQGGQVYYFLHLKTKPGYARVKTCYITSWRTWCGHATIIKTAEPR